MKDKIQVLDLEIDNLTAKDALKRVMSYEETEPVSVVEMVTMDTLGRVQQEWLAEFDLVLAGDKSMLEATGGADERQLKEVGELLFYKMVMRYLHKIGARVFLLAQDETNLQKLELHIRERYSNVQIMDVATMEENGASDDMLLNLVNGAEADWVLSVLLSPTEEQFVFKNKALINTRVWFGFGNLLEEIKREKSSFQKAKKFILRQLLKREMAKKGGNA